MEENGLESLLELPYSPTWLHAFILAVVKLNPSAAVRSVVLEDPHRAADLFKVSFLALWQSFDFRSLRDKIISTFEMFFTITGPSTSEIDALLTLLEYMDLNGHPVPLRIPIAATAAEKHELYAKVLFFRELEFRESSGLPSSDCVESLIAVNIKLGNLDCVHGLLKSSASAFVRVRPLWHEKLENFQGALSSYSVRLLEDPANPEWINGRMRCLSALGEWDRLIDVAGDSATACYNLQRWDQLSVALRKSSMQDFESLVYSAALAVRDGHFMEANSFVTKARGKLGSPILSAPAPHNKREYVRFLNQLQLVQLEEMIDYKQRPSDAALAGLVRVWNQRLLDLDYSLTVWRRLIPLRAVLLSPASEDIDTWVRYSTLARKKQNLTLSERIVEKLASERPEYHGVILSRIKNDYAAGRLEAATKGLQHFLSTEALTNQCTPYLLSKCCLAVGLWLPATDRRATHFIAKAVTYDPSSYKAWSTLALTKVRANGCSEEAVSALIQTISLSSQPPLPDVLRFLTLWFNSFGTSASLDALFESGFSGIPLKTWQPAIPQILARLRSRRPQLRSAVQRLLHRIGSEDPQSVVFALTVASRAETELLSSGAESVLTAIAACAPQLVRQCDCLATELVRISSSWTEQWAAALEEASRLYFVEKDIGRMIRLLTTANAKLAAGAETPSEQSFAKRHGAALTDAWTWVRKFVDSGNIFYLEQGWGIYYSVFQRLHKEVSELKQLGLARASPKLNSVHAVSVAVPGLSATGVTVHSVLPHVEILASKQRPRIVKIVGSDGRVYKYLLKGNEDLKQDERVMQLFGLVNTVIGDSVASRRRSGVFPTTPGVETLADVRLERFCVIPLSSQAGLIEWVDGCDTLHALIKAYRENRSIPLSLEHNLIRHIAPKFDDMRLMDKVQVFQAALAQTTGEELRQAMWLAAGGAEVYMRRRSMFSRSLAVTSIVGYVLGLGDRHPSNLMVERATGQVIHVDFGDCFDVAAERERYPEKIPFRLTRQLITALELGSVEGTFRITAERMLDLVRKNADSIMAMLEAFVYDPLVTWRLNTAEHAKTVLDRVHAKLAAHKSVAAHTDLLIREAVAPENLCQCYVGWCPFW